MYTSDVGETLGVGKQLDLPEKDYSTADSYLRSKRAWSLSTSQSMRANLKTSYCLVESGCTGPTFTPSDLSSGFTVLSLADESGVIGEEVVNSDGNDRVENMQLYARRAGEFAVRVLSERQKSTNVRSPGGVARSFSTTTSARRLSNASAFLDRCSHLRGKTDDLLMSPTTRFVVTGDGGGCMMTKTDSGGLEISLSSATQLKDLGLPTPSPSEATFLGNVEETPIFAISAPPSGPPLEGGEEMRNIRTSLPFLSPLAASLAKTANGIMHFRNSTKFCSKCGSPTTMTQSGHCASCTSCSNLTFPRNDPAMISLVTNPSRSAVLLAHSPRHPKGLYSCLAGFVEVGEGFEDAVFREVWEEGEIGGEVKVHR